MLFLFFKFSDSDNPKPFKINIRIRNFRLSDFRVSKISGNSDTGFRIFRIRILLNTPNCLCPPAGSFANPPTASEGVHIPNHRLLRAVTSPGKEIHYLSSEESLGSSNGELSSWSNIFAGVLRDLEIDPGEKKKPKKKKLKKKKVITIDPEPTSKKGGSSRTTIGASEKGSLRFRQSNLEDYVITSDSLEGLSRISEKKSSAAGSRSSGSAGSRNPIAGATPSSVALDEEEEEEEHEEPAAKLVSKKRSRETVDADIKVAQKAGDVPVIGKQRKLCTLYKFSPEAKKKTSEKKGFELKEPTELAEKKTKFVIKHPQKTVGTIEKIIKETDKEKKKEKEGEKENEKKKAVEKPGGDKSKETQTAATTAQDKAQGPEVVHITGLDQPLHEKKKETTQGKGPEVIKPTKPARVDALTQTAQVTSVAGGSTAGAHKETTTAAGGAGATGGAGGSMPQTPIGSKDTVGDIYYKTYTEEARGDAPHQAPWGLKQKDTFLKFGACRDWFFNSFPPGEVNRQRAPTHDGLYHAYVVGEKNTHTANHQSVREWRTMVKERAE
ncbi:hypothetical protein Hanom_Chr01g00092011 [Helianthus anomalus]